MSKIFCFYRISDNFQKTVDTEGNVKNKQKPSYVTKKKCLENFIKVFGNENFYIVADGCSKDTILYIHEITNIDDSHIFQTQFGNGAASFRKCMTIALDLAKNKKIFENDYIYFVEDDYIHKPLSRQIIMNGLEIFDYVTLYDHPDKYVNAGEHNEKGVVGNPYIEYNSEQTRVFLGDYCHWKMTNSTTMTFGTKLKTLKNDLGNILKYVSGDFPHDFSMFCELQNNGRTLGSSLPAFSTHCETIHLSPLTDWEKIIGFI
jgi:hypothetical protein